MKNICLIILVAFTIFSCHKEDEIFVELQNGKYFVEDGEEGTIKHRIYNFYNKYNTIILTNPVGEDYRYNFKNINNLYLVPPKQTKELLNKAIDLINYFLLGKDESFLNRYLPVTIQLADSVCGYKSSNPDIENLYNVTSSNNYIIISNIREDYLENLTEENKDIFKQEFWDEFWQNYFFQTKSFVNFPVNFYDICKLEMPRVVKFADYGYDPATITDKEKLHLIRKLGFINYSPSYLSSSHPAYDTPKIEEDFLQFIHECSKYTLEEIKVKYKDYPILLNRFDTFIKEMENQVGYKFF